MKVITKGGLVSVLLTTALGCSTGVGLRTDDSPTLNPTRSLDSDIKVYSTDDIGQPYDILGLVVGSADSADDPAKPISILKDQARKMGANAVVDARLETKEGFWNAGLQVSGVAVKFKSNDETRKR